MNAVAQSNFLDVDGLNVDIDLAGGVLHAVRNFSFSLKPGEAIGIVGESGSGKSMAMLGLMRLLPRRARSRANRLTLGGVDLLGVSDAGFARNFCGDKIAMIFQDPMSSLNPVYTIGRQLTETMLIGGRGNQEEATDRTLALLERVGIPEPDSCTGQYPHQLSGGQRQRVMIAMALMNTPELIIADEPTTALDVTVQAQILRLLAELRAELGMAMVLITHDLGVVSRTVDKIAVVYGGEIVETGSCNDILSAPRHPYTQGLLNCMPDIGAPDARLGAIPGIVPSLIGDIKGCSFANRCTHAEDACRTDAPPVQQLGPGKYYRCILTSDKTENAARNNFETKPAKIAGGESEQPAIQAENVSYAYQVRRGLFQPQRTLQAVDGVSLDIRRGETLALVGESGCGKSTLAAMLLGQRTPDTGTILLDGQPVRAVGALSRARRMQPIFQDPYGSLNPRRGIGEIIRRPLDIHEIDTPANRQLLVEETMAMVGLALRLFHSYPSQISGGQRQRVAIARAIIMKPDLLICDEPTSALDVSVQSQILNLLLDLRDELGLTFLIITHDIGVVDYMANRVAVMYLGQIVELGDKEQVLRAPKHPYTRLLLASVLTLDANAGLPPPEHGSGISNPLDMPPGCRFHPRCPHVTEQCISEPPPVRTFDGAEVRCILP